MTIRTFNVFTEPSLADPAWVLACVEKTDDNPLGYVEYADYSELKDLIASCERKQIENAAYAKAVNDVLSILGVSFNEYLDKKKRGANAV